MKNKIVLTAVILLAVTASACSIHGGNQKFVNPPTLGKELTDLKIAFDNGALGENEYNVKKQELITSERWNTGENHKH